MRKELVYFESDIATNLPLGEQSKSPIIKEINNIMEITRSWREQKVMLKLRFAILNDSDFQFSEGQRESMLDRLSQKLKKTKEELQSLFAELQTY